MHDISKVTFIQNPHPRKLNLAKKTKNKQYVKRTFFDIHCSLFTALRGTSSV